MAFTQDDIRANRNYLANKLRAEKPRAAVLHAAEGDAPYDFILLDTRGREAFANGHIPGAWCFRRVRSRSCRLCCRKTARS